MKGTKSLRQEHVMRNRRKANVIELESSKKSHAGFGEPCKDVSFYFKCNRKPLEGVSKIVLDFNRITLATV